MILFSFNLIRTGLMYHPSFLKVIGGLTNIKFFGRIENVNEVTALYRHHKYNRKLLYNDIGIVKIKKGFNLYHPSGTTQKIKLVESKFTQGSELQDIFEDCIALGWGLTKEKGR